MSFRDKLAEVYAEEDSERSLIDELIGLLLERLSILMDLVNEILQSLTSPSITFHTP